MGSRICNVLVWLIMLLCPSTSEDTFSVYPTDDRWVTRTTRRHLQPWETEKGCSLIRPTNRDIVKRICALMPYFDKDHANTAFLHKLRSTVLGMSDSEDLLEKEAAFYASVLIPLVFLQRYRDTWCLLERFHRALRLYQMSHPTEKRSSLKLLQNLKAVYQKVLGFILELPAPTSVQQEMVFIDPDDEPLTSDKKDLRYFKELMKNLG